MKFLRISIIVLAIIVTGGIIYITKHPSTPITLLQKTIYNSMPEIKANSFEPWNKPGSTVKENGILYLNDIKYANEYPNSYLDISYPSEDISIKRPTAIYIHGGGFFSGSKLFGDPLSANKNGPNFFDDIVLQGYNLVNIDYALTPEYTYPTPLIQLNQAIGYISEHSEKYNLDMNNVVIIGSSAGGSITAQYGLIVTKEDYAKELGIKPLISQNQIKALVVDDAILKTKYMDLLTATMIKTYFGTDTLDNKQGRQFDVISHVDENYIPTFLDAGNTCSYKKDTENMYNTLKKYNVDTEYYYIDKRYVKLRHCFMINKYANEYAKNCFNHMISFINKYTLNDSFN